MELNNDFYDNITETENAGYSFREQLFSNLPLNVPFDLSGAYAMQGGQYAPLANLGMGYTGTLAYGTNMFTMSSLNYPIRNGSPVPLYINKSTGGGLSQFGMVIKDSEEYPLSLNTAPYRFYCGFPSLYQNGAANTNYWWSPTATGYTGRLASAYSGSMVLGFSYAKTVMLVSLSGWNSDFTQRVGGYFDEYDFTNYPNVAQISCQLYTGSATSRGSSANLQFTFGTPSTDNFKAFMVDYNSETSTFSTVEKTNQYLKGYNILGFQQGTFFHTTDGKKSRSLLRGYDMTGFGEPNTTCYAGHIIPLYSFAVEHTVYNESANYTTYSYSLSKDEWAKVISTFGLYWTGTLSTAQGATTGTAATENTLRLPISKNGVYYGDYVFGTQIADAPNAEWGMDDNNPYDWWVDNGVSPNPDSNDYVDSMPLNVPTLTAFGTFNRAYAMTQVSLDTLADYLWNKSDSVFESLIKGLALFGDNPMQALIDCRMYPFDVLSLIGGGAVQPITIGRFQTDVLGVHLGNVTNAIVSLGSCEWRKYNSEKYNNDCFLDYSPYTQGVLYVPYVGQFTLNPDIYAGSIISCYLIVDFMTGACQCAIYKDGVLTEMRNGVIGVNVPFSSTDSAQWAKGVLSGVAQSLQGIVGTAGGISKDSVDSSAVISGVGGVIGGVMQAAFTPLPVQQKGAASSAASQWLPQDCYLMIYSPNAIEPQNYGNTIGYACEKSELLGSLSGFTVCANPDLTGFAGTQLEKEDIEKWLKLGVDL